ncbi:uncharacterized protein PHA67_013395 [Liasis olivaceus]
MLLGCILLHQKQTFKTCWFHGSSPVTSSATQTSISWKWEYNCNDSTVQVDAGNYGLEILETGMYFVYIYVARTEDDSSEDSFTVHLKANSSQVPLSLLKGVDAPRASVFMGRPYFLKNGIKLHLDINAGLTHIDCILTYWGLFKI